MINWQKVIKIALTAVITLALFKLFLITSEGSPKSFYADRGANGLYLIIISSFFIYNFLGARDKPRIILKLLVWLGIFTLPVIGYAFRFELEDFKDRIVSVLIPSYSRINKEGQLVIARNGDNHFYINAYSDNIKIRFLVDTGASDIALTKKDAIALGFKLDKLNYTRTYSTANGTSSGAPVKIKQLTIGNKTFFDLDAHVVSGDLDTSLFGMSVIGKFRSFKITKDTLTLY